MFCKSNAHGYVKEPIPRCQLKHIVDVFVGAGFLVLVVLFVSMFLVVPVFAVFVGVGFLVLVVLFVSMVLVAPVFGVFVGVAVLLVLFLAVARNAFFCFFCCCCCCCCCCHQSEGAGTALRSLPFDFFQA